MTVRVLHLTGSAVSDFYGDLSRLYAQDCLEATADPSRYEFHIAHVTPDRRWRFPADLSRGSIAAAPPMSLAEAVSHLITLEVDVMIPQMFCIPGMTIYRALFDLLGIPFVGSPPDVMALGAHKARARSVVSAAGVAVPPGETLRRGDRPSIPVPAVVKPVDTDNSLGLALVRDPRDWAAALGTAFSHSDEVLVESYVELGREVRCGIVVRDGELVCLPLEEYLVDSERNPIRSQDDKIGQRDDGDLRLMAKDSRVAWIVDPEDPITSRVWDVARRSHVALGCRDYSLFDFRIDPDGNPWFLEAGLYCSFARQSVVSMMAAAAGIPLDELFGTAVESALGRRG